MYINSKNAIAAISKSDKECKALMIYDDIVKTVKAFEGDIYGSYLRDWRIRGIPCFADLDIRLGPKMVKAFTNVLSMKYKVIPVTGKGGYVKDWHKSFEVKSKDGESHDKVKIDIVNCDKVGWQKWYADFDINSLGEDARCLYVRNKIPGIVDAITHVKERICNKQFCSISRPLYDMRNFEAQQGAKVDRAIKMVMMSWIMDDIVYGNDTWVVSKWTHLKKSPKTVRTEFDDYQCEQMLSRCVCAICHDEFNGDDVIVNTRCNHNFHWQCPYPLHTSPEQIDIEGNNENEPMHGLKHWVLRNKKHSCPTCREKIF
jgi:hypothetical protein